MNEVLDRITKKMKEEKITARKLCEELKINESNFVQWKKGKHGYIKHIYTISKILKTNVEYLLTGEENEDNAFLQKYKDAPEYIRKAIDILLNGNQENT